MSVFDDMDSLIVKVLGEDTLLRLSEPAEPDTIGLGEYKDIDLIAELRTRGYEIYKIDGTVINDFIKSQRSLTADEQKVINDDLFELL